MFPRYPEPNGRSKGYLELSRNVIDNPPEFFQRGTRKIAYLAESIEAKRVLDLACGASPFTKYLKDILGDTVEIVGADINPEILDLAKEYSNGSVDFIEFDIENPRDIGRFDLVYFLNSFHHFDDPVETLNIIYSLLENPGIFLLADISRCAPYQISESMIGRYLDARKRFLEGEENYKEIGDILGFDVSEADMLTADSFLAAYTPEELIKAVEKSPISHGKISAISGLMCFCGVRDSTDSICVETEKDFFKIYRKKPDSSLFLPHDF